MKQIRVSSTDVVFEKTRGNIKSDNINIFSVCLHTLEGKSVNSSLKTLRGVRWTKMYYICKHTDGKQTNGRTVVRLCATTFSHGAYKDDMITKINKFYILVQGITPLCRNYPQLDSSHINCNEHVWKWGIRFVFRNKTVFRNKLFSYMSYMLNKIRDKFFTMKCFKREKTLIEKSKTCVLW